MKIDLNCDMGESYGVYRLGLDEEVMKYITSANVACGFHAGDASVMERTLRLAKKAGVAVGAHVSYPDLQGFGRRFMDLTPEEVRQVCLYQLGALAGIARALGMELQHLKAHGALYNRAERDERTAQAIIEAVAQFDDRLLVFATPNSAMAAAAEQKGVRLAREAFADRAYNADGTLVSRRLEGAVLHDPEQIASRIVKLVRERRLTDINGQELDIRANTVCVHGDTQGAVEIVKRLRAALVDEGIEVVPVGQIV